jgi:hypothetical protein
MGMDKYIIKMIKGYKGIEMIKRILTDTYHLIKYLSTESQYLITVILSFLERERDRTVNVFDYSFHSVTAFRLKRS